MILFLSTHLTTILIFYSITLKVIFTFLVRIFALHIPLFSIDVFLFHSLIRLVVCLISLMSIYQLGFGF